MKIIFIGLKEGLPGESPAVKGLSSLPGYQSQIAKKILREREICREKSS